MAPPALVLVHGAVHAADCWDLTIGEIRRLAPELAVLAVDLPGRRGKPGDLATVTIADWVASVVADTLAAPFGGLARRGAASRRSVACRPSSRWTPAMT